MELGPPVPSGSGLGSGLGLGSGSGLGLGSEVRSWVRVRVRGQGTREQLSINCFPSRSRPGDKRISFSDTLLMRAGSQVIKLAGREADDVAQVDWGRDRADPGLGGATQTLASARAQGYDWRALGGAPSHSLAGRGLGGLPALREQGLGEKTCCGGPHPGVGGVLTGICVRHSGIHQ